MAIPHGMNAAVIVDDTALTSFANSVEASGDGEVSETTVFGAGVISKTFIRGNTNGTITLAGFYDSTSPGPDVELSARRTTAVLKPLTFGPEGFAIGSRVKLADILLTRYGVSSPVGNAVSFTSEFQTTDGLEAGHSLKPLDTTSGNGTGVDNLAATTNGGVGAMHVTQNTRDGTSTIKIQHSTDNSVFVDLITFTGVPASTTDSERLEVTGTVNRYTRSVVTLGGTTGTLTTLVSFARR